MARLHCCELGCGHLNLGHKMPRSLRRVCRFILLFAILACIFVTIVDIFERLCCKSSYVRARGILHVPGNAGTVVNNTTATTQALLPCPENPPSLRGQLEFIDVNATSLNLNLSTYYGGEIEVGGFWRPKHCKARKKVAFMIPFRNRWEQLNTFLNHMHPIFQKQQLDYRIFVIEQAGKDKFNKGAIYNLGFKETFKYDDYDCHVFHDVDLLCETDTNYYGCPNSPMHLSVGIDKFNYTLLYSQLIGGIQLFSKEHYLKINGYSNQFWGWGGEDDNLFRRIKAKGLKLIRPSVDVARYKMNQRKHFRSDLWSRANSLLIRSRRAKSDVDGLTTTDKLSFTIETRGSLLYTFISINLHQKR